MNDYRLQVKDENIRVLAELLQGNPENVQEVMKHFPSIGYNGVKWTAASTVTYVEEKRGKPLIIAERTKLANYQMDLGGETFHTHDRILRGAKYCVELYLTDVATCASFKAFKTILQTADALERADHSAFILQGNGGAWRAQKSLEQTTDALKRAGHFASILLDAGGSLKAQKSIVHTADALLFCRWCFTICVEGQLLIVTRKTLLIG